MKKWYLPTFIDIRQVEQDSVHHGIKIIQANNLPALQTAVNAYLLLLESDSLPPFYLEYVDVQHYDALFGQERYFAVIKLVSLGEFELPD